MALRPVEFQSSLPELTEVGRMEKAKEVHWQVKNQQFAAELQKRALNRLKQVGNPDNAAKTRTEADGERQDGQQSVPDHRRQGKSESTEEGNVRDETGSVGAYLDIRT